MADFKKIIGFIRKWEGGYVNDPDDDGGETYCGISRYKNPKWEGWATVDAHKLKEGNIIADAKLNAMVDDFYFKKYWCAVGADAINSQGVANMASDWQVNSGDVSTKSLQRIVGVFPDGVVGPKTIAAINAMPAALLLTKLRQYRIDFYHDLVRRKPKNQKYLKGWLNRTAQVPVN